jgi:hypothetical protein
VGVGRGVAVVVEMGKAVEEEGVMVHLVREGAGHLVLVAVEAGCMQQQQQAHERECPSHVAQGRFKHMHRLKSSWTG